MKVRFTLVLFCSLVAGMHEARAQGTASSKATADINTLVRCNMSTQQIDDTVSWPSSCVNLFTGSGDAIDAKLCPREFVVGRISRGLRGLHGLARTVPIFRLF